VVSDVKDTMTKISTVIDDELSKFEERNLEISMMREWEIE